MATTSGAQPNRRTIVKGMAWTVPAVTVVGVAPAFAASPEPGLNGWVIISRSQRRGNWPNYRYTCYVHYDGYRDNATYHTDGTRLGLWVFDATIAQVSAIKITFHLPYQVDEWQAEDGNIGWSVPVADGTQDGFYRYTSFYSGSMTQGTDDQGRPEVLLVGRPNFTGTVSGRCSTDRRQKITRSATVNGQVLAFTREVRFPAAVGTYNLMAPQSVSPEESLEGVEPEVAEEPIDDGVGEWVSPTRAS